MATYASLEQRWRHIDSVFAEHHDQILALQSSPALLHEPVLAGRHDSDRDSDRAQAFLSDPITLFRFLRKAHFDDLHACELLQRTLKWRLESSIDMVAPSSIDTLYSENPLFYLHPSIKDKFGRPAAVINMRWMVRPEDSSLDSLKEFMAFMLEIARRYLADLSKRDSAGSPHIQMVILLDLAGSSLSNLEVEMLPFIMDLLKHHFPGMIGATYILNYGWAYAGMWAVAKRVLPKVALEKILFPAKAELLTFFHAENLLVGPYCTVSLCEYLLTAPIHRTWRHLEVRLSAVQQPCLHKIWKAFLLPSPSHVHWHSITLCFAISCGFSFDLTRCFFRKSWARYILFGAEHSKDGQQCSHPSWLTSKFTQSAQRAWLQAHSALARHDNVADAFCRQAQSSWKVVVASGSGRD